MVKIKILEITSAYEWDKYDEPTQYEHFIDTETPWEEVTDKEYLYLIQYASETNRSAGYMDTKPKIVVVQEMGVKETLATTVAEFLEKAKSKKEAATQRAKKAAETRKKKAEAKKKKQEEEELEIYKKLAKKFEDDQRTKH